MHEASPSNPPAPSERERLEWRRSKRMRDARAAANRRPTLAETFRSVECEEAAQEANDEAAISEAVAEKTILLELGLSEPESLIFMRGHHAAERLLASIGANTDSALMPVWRRRKEQQRLPSTTTASITEEKTPTGQGGNRARCETSPIGGAD